MTLLTPQLELQKTVNNPYEPSAVIGFHGRDHHFGRDAAVYKAEDLPTSPRRVGVPGFSAPVALYILTEDTVYGMDGRSTTSASFHTFSPDAWEYHSVSVPSFKWEQFDTWERDEVEVR